MAQCGCIFRFLSTIPKSRFARKTNILQCLALAGCVSAPAPASSDARAVDATVPDDATLADGTVSIDAAIDASADAALGPTLVGNTVLSGPAGITVLNQALEIRFPPDQRSPSTLFAATSGERTNLLFDEDFDERLAGILHWQTLFSYENRLDTPNELLLQGPVVAQVQLTWEATHAPDNTMSGVSIYTLYPDGRIHRSERFVAQSTESTSFLTGYVALRDELFRQVHWNLDTMDGSTELSGTNPRELFQSDSKTGYSCATGPNGRVGWTFASMGDSLVGPRAYHHANLGQIALQLDWVRQFPAATVPNSPRAGALLMHISPVEQSPGNEDCSDLGDVTRALQNPRLLAVTTGSTVTDHPDDAQGDGYAEGRGHYTVRADNHGEVAFSFDAQGDPSRTAAPTTVVLVRDLGESGTPIVQQDSQTLAANVDYLFQANGTDGWFYFPKPLNASEMRIFLPQ